MLFEDAVVVGVADVLLLELLTILLRLLLWFTTIEWDLLVRGILGKEGDLFLFFFESLSLSLSFFESLSFFVMRPMANQERLC